MTHGHGLNYWALRVFESMSQGTDYLLVGTGKDIRETALFIMKARKEISHVRLDQLGFIQPGHMTGHKYKAQSRSHLSGSHNHEHPLETRIHKCSMLRVCPRV